MKIYNLIIAFILLGSTITFAQSGSDLYREAKKAYSAYEINTGENFPKLIEAADQIDKAVQTEDFKKDAKALNLAGEIHNKVAEAETIFLNLDSKYELKHTDAASKAFNYFKKALEYSDKNRYKVDARNGMMMAASHLSTLGNVYLASQDYVSAYKPLNQVLMVDDVLLADGEEGVFQNAEDRDNHKYVTAITATQAQDIERASVLLEELVSKEYNEPNVYSTYFNLLVSENPEKAQEVLNTAKVKFPENQDILYAEINYLISQKKYDKLESLLQLAVEKDPENASIRNALGNVYMNLYETTDVETSPEKSKDYFDKASSYFEQAIDLDSEFFDAIYSIGSLYFNKAAAKTETMANLGISNEDLKKYDVLDKEVKELFNKALPYFKKAERMNPNDMNTIIALKEIYARLDNLEMVKEFSTRLNKVQAGENITESYFSN